MKKATSRVRPLRVLFGEGNEFLAIPLATTDGTDTWLGIYDTCRAIRRGR